MAEPIPIGVAITMVINIMIRVFTIFPAIPFVPLRTLVTDVRKDQSTVFIPLANTYNMIPTSRITENPAQMYIRAYMR